MSFDVSQILIILLLIVIILLALKLFKKQKIKQTRYKSDSGDTVKSLRDINAFFAKEFAKLGAKYQIRPKP